MTPLLEAALWNAAAATVLGGLAFLASKSARRPALAHALWLFALLKLVTPPLIAWPLLPAEAAAATAAPEAAVASITPETITVLIPEDVEYLPPPPSPVPPPAPAAAEPAGKTTRASDLLLAGWLAGAVFLLLLAVSRAIRFGRIVRGAERAPPALIASCGQLAERLKVRRRLDLRIVRGRISPLIWVVPGRARVLLPDGLLADLDREEREAVLAHELAHLARRDHLVRWLELLIVSLWWWFPVAWWVRRGLREAEERCCDAWVAWAIPGNGGSYASALMKTLDFLAGARPPQLAVASGMGSAGRVERRFRMIIDGRRHPRRLSLFARLTMLVFALAVLPGTVGVATAQEPEPAKEAPPPKPAEDEYEKRLERLEKLTETLVEELKALRSDRAKANSARADDWVKYAQTLKSLKSVRYRLGVQSFPVTVRGTDGRQYVVFAQTGLVMCTDSESGKRIWVANLQEPIRGSVKIAGNGRLLVESAKEDGKVFTIDPATGKVLEASHWGHTRLSDPDTKPEELRVLLNTLEMKLERIRMAHLDRLADVDRRLAELHREKMGLQNAHDRECTDLGEAIERIRHKLESGK